MPTVKTHWTRRQILLQIDLQPVLAHESLRPVDQEQDQAHADDDDAHDDNGDAHEPVHCAASVHVRRHSEYRDGGYRTAELLHSTLRARSHYTGRRRSAPSKILEQAKSYETVYTRSVEFSGHRATSVRMF